ncbi:MAG: SURF1 family protein [Ilumatobacteraceae bacterium]
MYRFLLRPKWLAFHLLVLGGIVLMVNLGFWQLRRLDQRQAFNAVIEERYDAPPVPLDDLLQPGTDPDAVVWRPVTTSGTYLPDGGFLLVNRSQGGRPGVDPVVPLRLDDGRILLVNRGFTPTGDETPPVPATTVVDVTGRLRTSQDRTLGQLSDPATGVLTEAQRIDLERLAPQFDGTLVPMYVDLITSSPPEQLGLPEPVAAPVLGEGNHLSYAVQWYIFSIAVAVGWVLAVRRSIQVRSGRSCASSAAP